MFLSLWLIDGLGMMLVAPALLAWIDDAVPEADSGHRSVDIFDLSSVLMTLLVTATSLSLASWEQVQYSYMVLFAYFPILAWSAVRMSERANALTLLISAMPLLAAWAYQVSTPEASSYAKAIQASVIAFCAVLVALVLQAIAADRRLAILRVARQSRQDMSTGLLNDRGLLAELGDRLVSPNRVNYGLIGLHVTNFDSINDLCGTIDAIQLEQSTAALLLRQGQVQFAARLSAGRYAMVIGADTVTQVRTVAREVYSQLNGQIFQTERGSLRLQCCVGGLLLDRHTLISSEDCIFSLGDALAIAASVRDPQLFVEPLSQMMIDARRAHQSKIEHIREAIRDNRIELFAQPVIDPEAPPHMRSYELLTRLRDRDGGLVQPPEFMTLASQAQMSIPLDRAVIHRAFEWLAANPESLTITWKCSINLAGATMCDGAIADYIREQRSRYCIPADKIVFEITESEAIRNPAAASRLVDDLKEQGFGIALDDFGTGLATFEYLKRFPLDYLKIDGSFIRNLMSNPIDEEIVISTIRVAARLKLRTVAEHVHSAAVYERLTELGITFLQGDYFGKAIPLREFFGLDLQGRCRQARLKQRPPGPWPADSQSAAARRRTSQFADREQAAVVEAAPDQLDTDRQAVFAHHQRQADRRKPEQRSHRAEHRIAGRFETRRRSTRSADGSIERITTVEQRIDLVVQGSGLQDSLLVVDRAHLPARLDQFHQPRTHPLPAALEFAAKVEGNLGAHDRVQHPVHFECRIAEIECHAARSEILSQLGETAPRVVEPRAPRAASAACRTAAPAAARIGRQ